MKKLLFCLFSLAFFIGFESCRQDSDVVIPIDSVKIPKDSLPKPIGKDTVWEKENTLTLGVKLKIDTLLEQVKKVSATRKINVSQENVLRFSAEKINVLLPKDFCTTSDDKPVTGQVDVVVKILRTKGDLLSENRPTVSNGRLLISGGVVFISASSNGAALKVGKNKTIRIAYDMPSPDPQMSFFEGQQNPTNPLLFNWVQPTNNDIQTLNAQPRPIVDTTGGTRNPLDSVIGYNIFTDRFGWINCDKFSGQPNLTNKFCASLPDSFTNKNTKVFVVFKDIFSMITLSGDAEKKQFCIPNGYQGIPIGSKVVVVSVSYLGEKVYLASQETTVAADANIKLTPLSVTLDDLKTAISKL